MPELTFFCELEEHALAALFHDPNVVEDLSALGAAVSLGLIDLSEGRAEVVRQLNAAGIPVTAWLLLPRSEGYWFNLGNAQAASRRYAEFRRWTEDNDLRWAAVGLDIEPDIEEVLGEGSRPLAQARAVLSRVQDGERIIRGREQYQALVSRIRDDGYLVESYQMPPIVDERRAGSALLQRARGLVDLAVDREVLMLYTSLMPGGAGALWSYAADAEAIAVGSTGGGVDAKAKLSWDELERDLLLAHCWTEDLYIFSLEGCVQRGYMARLRDFDWSRPVAAPFAAAGQIDGARALFRGGLWLSAHPATLLAVPAFLAGWRLLRRREASQNT